jgi:precorrin-2 dehydrogenase
MPAPRMRENSLLTRVRLRYDAGVAELPFGSAMELFPISVCLEGRKVLVVGAGTVGAARAEGLLRAGAGVHVVAPRATEWVRSNASEQKLHWHAREFTADDLEGMFLVVAATDSPGVNQEVFHTAAARRVLCNVVDDPEHCDFFYPAVVRRGALQIAVSTGGMSPALAHRLRVELEEKFRPEYEEWVDEVGRQRGEILLRDLPDSQRRELLEQIASRESFEDFLRRRNLQPEP